MAGGTGSKSPRATELFVPEWRATGDAEFLDNSGPGRALHDHCHLYRISRAAHPGPLSLAMAGVGIAQHAVDYATEHVGRLGVGRTSATERLFKAAGSRALFVGNELQRCFRDVHAVASRMTRLAAIGRISSGDV